MRLSRRDLTLLLPALTAGQPGRLPSKIYRSSRIPYEGDAKKKGRAFFKGTNHSARNAAATPCRYELRGVS